MHSGAVAFAILSDVLLDSLLLDPLSCSSAVEKGILRFALCYSHCLYNLIVSAIIITIVGTIGIISISINMMFLSSSPTVPVLFSEFPYVITTTTIIMIFFLINIIINLVFFIHQRSIVVL